MSHYIIADDMVINISHIHKVDCDLEKCIIKYSRHPDTKHKLTSICSKMENEESYTNLYNKTYLKHNNTDPNTNTRKSIKTKNYDEYIKHLPFTKRNNANIQNVWCESDKCHIKYNTGNKREYYKTIKNNKKV